LIKILILHTSLTGNTEQIAYLLKTQLDDGRFDITTRDIGYQNIEVNDLQDFDGILVGTYTYDDGNLPYEIEDFHDELDNVDLTNKVIGIFGSGDRSYSYFCNAVNLFKAQFQKTNATVIEHTVKVELYPEEDEDLESIRTLGQQFAEALQTK
jgi:flavodoxin I